MHDNECLRGLWRADRKDGAEVPALWRRAAIQDRPGRVPDLGCAVLRNHIRRDVAVTLNVGEGEILACSTGA